MRLLISAFVAVLMGMMFLPGSVHAFDIAPTVSLIELPKNGSGISVIVRNPRKVELPVSMEIFERFVDEDGSERREPADEQFLIFPPQAVIPPGGTQAIRVQWLFAPPKTSRSFTLYATEIPVDLSDSNKSQVQTLLRMGASVHVAAAVTQAKPVLIGAAPNERGVSVTLANEGDRFYYIDTVVLDFAGKRITGIDLANAAGRTLVPPGGRRTFTVADVTGLPALIAR